jgi:hypothetical protein
MRNFQIFYDALKATFQDKGVPFPLALAFILEPPTSGNNTQVPTPPPIPYVFFSLNNKSLKMETTAAAMTKDRTTLRSMNAKNPSQSWFLKVDEAGGLVARKTSSEIDESNQK